MGNASRSAKRRKKAKAVKIDGDEVVFAIAVTKDGLYRNWIRGPSTNHSNGQMIELMALLAATLAIESAKFSGCSVQEAMDDSVKLYVNALRMSIHKILSSEYDMGEMTTVPIDVPPDQPPGPTGLAAKTTEA